MLSGEARPIVIFEKVALGRFSFLIAILQLCGFLYFLLSTYAIEYQSFRQKLPLMDKANLPKLRGQRYEFTAKKLYFLGPWGRPYVHKNISIRNNPSFSLPLPS